jgi:hypothetical protein
MDDIMAARLFEIAYDLGNYAATTSPGIMKIKGAFGPVEVAYGIDCLVTPAENIGWSRSCGQWQYPPTFKQNFMHC